ncbi:uncharacterized protein NEMAJ01_1330 [Nematocida major]|uniref:uncharacterized protein n=1 Tax=Nematocida major TaxID=1912982 RepID=UPI002007828C|nr:uncharacterized protein NEMAJ01_1330 [Nematocida major]KAH9386434.1 hypothetical protein NEMAJ01_1330 [Nematocida major]
MNTESIKRLAEADKKAHDLIQEARRRKEALNESAIKKGEAYNAELMEAKVAEVNRYFVQANEELAQTEKAIINSINEKIENIKSKEKVCDEIVDEIVSAVVGATDSLSGLAGRH